mmetsp:Transcript_4700/g.16222  ORF Transcript_4700/g.16222 Transcript_4700/m.16222 type:complete len:359 (-) Transcript_4700:314-1390(-)
MVRYAAVLPVVRPNLFAARSGADLRLAAVGNLRELLLELHLVELGAQHLEGSLFVLELRASLRAEDADPRRLVHEIHRRLHLVDVLPARSAAPRGANLDVGVVDLDVDVVHLGHDSDGGGARLHAPLRLGDGDALHAVHARLPLEATVHLVPLELEHGFAVAPAVVGAKLHELRLPTHTLGVPLVHAHEFARPQARLVAARARAHLEHDVLAVERVGRQEQDRQPLLLLLERPFQHLHLLLRHRCHLLVVRRLLRHLRSARELLLDALVLGVPLHHAVQVSHHPCHLLVLRNVARHLRVPEPLRQLRVRLGRRFQLGNHVRRCRHAHRRIAPTAGCRRGSRPGCSASSRGTWPRSASR